MARSAIREEVLRHLHYRPLLEQLGRFEEVGEDEYVLVPIEEERGAKAFWIAPGGSIGVSSIQSHALQMPLDVVGFHLVEESNLEEDDLLRVQAFFGVDSPALAERSAVLAEVDRLAKKLGPAAGREMTTQIVRRLAGILRAGDPHNAMTVDDVRNRGRIPLVLRWGSSARPAPDGAEEVLFDMAVPRADLAEDHLGFFPLDEQFVVGRGALRSAQFGPVRFKEFGENDAWYWHVLGKVELGIVNLMPAPKIAVQ